ncbi:hypothetical protein PENTCL1PPCAC_20062, partial [Pristionchus entomophagus]
VSPSNGESGSVGFNHPPVIRTVKRKQENAKGTPKKPKQIESSDGVDKKKTRVRIIETPETEEDPSSSEINLKSALELAIGI